MIAIDLRPLGERTIAFYLALEEYIQANYESDVFFIWNIPESIIIGKHQLLGAEVNKAYANQKGISIFRRPSGGGAIYADGGCFMYSFITKKRNRNSIYHTYLQLIIDFFSRRGVKVTFSGRNDLLLDGKKISGAAMYSNYIGSVLHGTMLYDTNLEELVKCITPDDTKLISKGIKSVSDRVTNVKPHLNLSKMEFMEMLVYEIGEVIDILSDDAIDQINKSAVKYEQASWIEGTNPMYNFKNSARFTWGKLDVCIAIKKEKIQSMSLSGDFFTSNELAYFTDRFKGVPFNSKAIKQVLSENPIKDYIIGSSNEEFIELIAGGDANENLSI